MHVLVTQIKQINPQLLDKDKQIDSIKHIHSKEPVKSARIGKKNRRFSTSIIMRAKLRYKRESVFGPAAKMSREVVDFKSGWNFFL